MSNQYSARNDKKVLHGVSNHIVSISLHNLLSDMDISSSIEDIWTDLISMNDKFGTKVLPIKELKKELDSRIAYDKSEKCWIFSSKKEYQKFIKDMAFMVSMKIVGYIESSGIGNLVMDNNGKIILAPTIQRDNNNVYNKYLKVIGG